MPSKARLKGDKPKSSINGLKGLKGFLGLLSFSTIIPLNIHSSIQEMARITWSWPIIGGFIGILVGLLGFILLDLIQMPQLIAAAVVYSFAIWITGFHHLDGLVDFGDAVMAHADPPKRISIMRDQRIGTGGLAYLLIVALITFASIAYIPVGSIFFVLLMAEISAKLGLLTCCTFSKPYSDGTGMYFIEAMDIKMLTLSLVITLIIGFLALKNIGILAILGGLVGGIIMALIARWKFIYVTGDILGASNEISRMIALLIMVTFLQL